MNRIKLALVGSLASAAMIVAAAPASAASNNQSGLVNVNVQNLKLQVPVSVAVPISVAANVCGIDVNVLATQLQNGAVGCTAMTDSRALNTAVANSMMTGTGGGPTSNNQSGLVNVNVQRVGLQVPVSVALPIGLAANVCGVDANVLAHQAHTGSGASCTATSTSQALSRAIANAMI